MPSLNWERDEDYDDDDCANSHVAHYEASGNSFVLTAWSDPSGSDWSYAVECTSDDEDESDTDSEFLSLEEAQEAAEEAAKEWGQE